MHNPMCVLCLKKSRGLGQSPSLIPLSVEGLPEWWSTLLNREGVCPIPAEPEHSV